MSFPIDDTVRMGDLGGNGGPILSSGYLFLFIVVALGFVSAAAGLYVLFRQRQNQKLRLIEHREQMRRCRGSLRKASTEEGVLKAVAEGLVPHLATWILISTGQSESGPRRFYAASIQSDKKKTLEDFAQQHQGVNLLQVLGTTEKYADLRRALGFRSVIELPLRGRAGAMLGSVLIAIPNRQTESIEFIESAVDLAGLCLENLRQVRATDSVKGALNDTLEVVNRDVKMGLMSILLNADLLIDRLPFQQEAESPHAQAERIKLVSRQIQTMIGDLADAARLKAGVLSFRPTSEDVEELLDEAFSLAAEEKTILKPSLEIIGAKNLEAFCDGNRTLLSFSRIFQALIEVSAKQSVMNAKVSTDNDTDQVVISIDGVGCTDKTLRDLFHKKNNYSLVMARGFLEAQGGGMQIEKNADGSAVLDLRLPRFHAKRRGAISSGAA